MAGTKHLSDTIETSGKHIRLVDGGHLVPTAPSIFDHFAYGAGAFNSHVPQNWVTTETGSGTPFAPGATGVTVAIGATGGTTNNGEELAGKLVGWNPSTMDDMNLVVEARFKTLSATTAAAGDFYFGFADAVTYTNSLPYVISAASADTTSVPTEFCGFAYSSIPTSGVLYAASGNNYIGAVTTIANVNTITASTKQKDSNYHVYRIELTTGGEAVFYYDGEQVMAVTDAITANTAFTPYLCAVAKASLVQTMTLDYLYVGGSIV